MKPASTVTGYIALALWLTAIVSAFAAIWAFNDPQTIDKAWNTTGIATAFALTLTIIWKLLPHSIHHYRRH